ncbi:MAG: hypothetical protein E6614_31870, partial [Bradyrhizobium sp.]|nr:hypothetical protein [Bradyrhizobium sp.]
CPEILQTVRVEAALHGPPWRDTGRHRRAGSKRSPPLKSGQDGECIVNRRSSHPALGQAEESFALQGVK